MQHYIIKKAVKKKYNLFLMNKTRPAVSSIQQPRTVNSRIALVHAPQTKMKAPYSSAYLKNSTYKI